MFRNRISSCYAQRDSSFTDEGGDIGSGEENEGDREVLDEGYIETRFAAELDVCAF
jgi:hypothetical protein